MKIFNTKIQLSFIIIALSCGHALAANPNVTTQNGKKTWTYNANKNIGNVNIPNDVRRIVINGGVTLTGTFNCGSRANIITIEGKNRNTSILRGASHTPPPNAGGTPVDPENTAGIRCTGGSGKMIVKNMTVKDYKGRGIIRWVGNLQVNKVNVQHGVYHTHTDGIHATATGHGKASISNSFISTHDDATYLRMTSNIKNSTIVHQRNGAPFQISWGLPATGPNESANDYTKIDNVKIKHNNTSYNQKGTVSWHRKNASGADALNIEFVNGFSRSNNSGKTAARKYYFGNGVNNATIRVRGWSRDSISNNGNNNSVVSW